MIWLFLFIALTIALFMIVPISSIAKIWPIGLLSILLLYLIDSTLISLNAYKFSFGNELLSGIPLFYFLSSFGMGIILTYKYPKKHNLKLPYILLATVILLLLEYLMYRLNYFHYINWNIYRSFFLNLFGFIVILWLAEWFRFTD